jgi:mono/diheme cytochrome c family protein
MTPKLTVVLFLIVWPAGCSTAGSDVREWRADDHSQPEVGAIDPARVPSELGKDAGSPEQNVARALWMVSCAGCHGPEGRGDGSQRPPGAVVADLTQAGWQQARSDAQIAQVIAAGRGMMPGFAEQLGKEGIAMLVKVVRGMGKPEAPGLKQGSRSQ